MGRRKKVSNEQLQEIMQMYRDGASYLKLEHATGVSPEIVKRILIENGVALKPVSERVAIRQRTIDHVVVDPEVISKYEKGESTFDIAKSMGMVPSSVLLILQRHGVKMRDRKSEALRKRKQYFELQRNSAATIKENEIIKVEYNRGTPIAEIASTVGLAEKAITDRLKRLGVTLNRKHDRGVPIQTKCACGECDEMVWNLDGQRRFRKYVKGHYSRVKRGIVASHKNEIIRAYKQGYNTLQIGTLLGCGANLINSLLKEWNIRIYRSSTMGRQAFTDDGHKVRSGMELFVDNWLFRNRIAHIYDKQIGESKYRYDFYLPDHNVYIEVCGLDTPAYFRKMETKLKLYTKFGLARDLLLIFPNDNIEEKLNEIIKRGQRSTVTNEAA